MARIFSNKKVIYTDADSLSEDLGAEIRKGNKDALNRLKDFAATDDPKYPHSRPRALYELAEVYFNGFCEVEPSTQTALEFLTQAADSGDDLALIKLGEFYRDGTHDFKLDGEKAAELFAKAVERGNQRGLRLAAEIYRDGLGGLAADGYRALDFYAALDALDDKQAPFDMADLYERGCGRLMPDGLKALEIYDEIINHGEYWMTVFRDFNINGPRFGDYQRALQAASEIYRYGKAGVRADEHMTAKYFDKLIESYALI